MDKHSNILSFLGLCLRGGNLTVGEEPVEAVARARDARVLLLASDAADNTRRRCAHFAEMGQCLWLRVPFTKAELGRAVGRSAAAIVAITDIGLANAVVHRLAELDPVHYDEAAAKLDLKAQVPPSAAPSRRPTRRTFVPARSRRRNLLSRRFPRPSRRSSPPMSASRRRRNILPERAPAVPPGTTARSPGRRRTLTPTAAL